MRIHRQVAIAVSVAAITAITQWGAPAQADTKDSAARSTAGIQGCIDVPNRDIGRGSTGDYVREVQCLLNWAVLPSTYHSIAVDGDFGPDTEGKVITFQRCANALGAGLDVDGRVGPQTAPHLEWWAGHSQWIC